MSLINIYLETIFERPIFKELSWYTVAQILVLSFSFLGVIIISRYLGPSQLGLYSFTQNYVAIFLAVAGSVDFYIMWKIAKVPSNLTAVGDQVGHKINIYIVLVFLGVTSAWITLPNDVAFFVSIMLAPVFLQSFNVFSIYAVATSRASLISVVQVLAAFILFGMKIFLVFVGASLVWFVGIATLDLILTGIIMSVYFLRIPEWREVFSRFKVPSFMTSASFFYSIRASIFAVVSWQYLLRADQLVLATFSNAHALGIYSAAVKVAEVPNFLAGVLSTALVSRIAYISTNSDVASKNKLNKMTTYYLIAGTVIGLFILVFAPLAIQVLYGSEFSESIPVLRAYALTIPGMFLTYFFIGVYGARGRYYLQAIIFGLSIAVNIVLVYLLTPIYGLVGTAMATVIAYTGASLALYFNLKYTNEKNI